MLQNMPSEYAVLCIIETLYGMCYIDATGYVITRILNILM